MTRHIFLTGITGFVGRNLFVHLYNSNPDTKFTILVRGQSQAEAENRFLNVLKSLTSEIEISAVLKCTKVLVGNVTEYRLGLSSTIYDQLSRNVTHIIHSAANVSFQQSLAEARLCNVGGTRQIIELAEQVQKNGKLNRLAYISTAFACGKHSGVVYENTVFRNPKFDNNYQQSKYEAEQLLYARKSDLPITIFRPSIIVGNSKTGRTCAFNVIYYPLKLLYRGLLKYIPGSPDTPLDIVPIDFVCEAINHILFRSKQDIGNTFHLTAGPENITTVGELLEKAMDYFTHTTPGSSIHSPKFISPKFFRSVEILFFWHRKEFLKKLKPYIPFLTTIKVFDNSNTLSALSDGSIKAPQLSQYINRLLQYCLDVDWGHKVPSFS